MSFWTPPEKTSFVFFGEPEICGVYLIDPNLILAKCACQGSSPALDGVIVA